MAWSALAIEQPAHGIPWKLHGELERYRGPGVAQDSSFAGAGLRWGSLRCAATEAQFCSRVVRQIYRVGVAAAECEASIPCIEAVPCFGKSFD
jgi:hypothetical protein